jgi:hypothetical protein
LDGVERVVLVDVTKVIVLFVVFVALGGYRDCEKSFEVKILGSQEGLRGVEGKRGLQISKCRDCIKQVRLTVPAAGVHSMGNMLSTQMGSECWKREISMDTASGIAINAAHPCGPASVVPGLGLLQRGRQGRGTAHGMEENKKKNKPTSTHFRRRAAVVPGLGLRSAARGRL